jgi:CRP-like cAMP-binding protein
LDIRENLEQIIRRHPFWKKLDPVYFHILEHYATLVTWGVDQPVFQEGASAEHFYLIHRGSVSLETVVRGKHVVTIQTLGAGEALGWSWLFSPYRWHFSARSRAVTEAVVFEAIALREYAQENHDFGYDLAKRVAQVMLDRLQATRLRLANFYGPISNE